MRLSSVVLATSSMAENVILAVQEQEPNNRYLIRAMVGIDGEDIVPKFIGFGLVTGKKFYEYTMKPRDIVMRIALNPVFAVNEDITELRDRIYKIISADRTGELDLQFKDGSAIVCAIKGSITKLEVPYFTKTPELQLTIRCNDAIFRSVAPSHEDIPTESPVIIDDDLSSAPHGLSFKVKFTAVTTTFVVQDHATTPDWKFQVTPPTSFQINDELWFSSEYGMKQVFWNKSVGTDIELMDKVISGSIWPIVFPGITELHFPQIDNIDFLEMKYYAAYWGI